nr:PREDICTED: S100P-binding protein-like [Struthio camelus australis]
MDDHSPHAFGLCHFHEFKPTVNNTVPRAKRPLDPRGEAQVLQAAKKACAVSHHCSIPCPSEKLLLCSPDSACFQGSSHFLDDTGHDELVASSSESKYNDVAISLDTARCFDDSEPDDSLLELSGSEQGNSPFNYTEEEIQEILADDCLGSEQYTTRKSTVSQNVNGESEKDVSSSCTGASVISEDVKVASKITEKPNIPLSRVCSSVEMANSNVNDLRSAQVTGMLFDLDIQELLNLSPIDADYVDQPPEDSRLEETKRETSQAMISDCLEYDKINANNLILGESLEWLMSKGQHSLGVDHMGKTPFTSRDMTNLHGGPAETSVPSSDLACDPSKADESSAPVLLMYLQPSPGSQHQDLSKATNSSFSGKFDPSKDDGRQESSEAEQPSDSIKLSATAVGQIGQKDTTGGKKLGKVTPVPQVEERLKQGAGISEAELEQKKHLYPVCACPCEEICRSYTRDLSSAAAGTRNRKPPTCPLC